jgi:hypothetical protein
MQTRSIAPFILAFSLATLATVTFGNGFLVWAVFLFFLAIDRELWARPWATGTCLASLCVALALGWKDTNAVLNGIDPLLNLQGLLALLSVAVIAPISTFPSSAAYIVLGLVLALFAAATLYVYLQEAAKRDLVRKYLGLVAFSISSCLLVVLVRQPEGLAGFLNPRYSMISNLAVVGTYLFFAVLGWNRTHQSAIVFVLGSLLLVGAALSDYDGLKMAPHVRTAFRGMEAQLKVGVGSLSADDMVRKFYISRGNAPLVARVSDFLRCNHLSLYSTSGMLSRRGSGGRIYPLQSTCD